MNQLLEFAIEVARFAGSLLATKEEIDQDGQDQCFQHGFRVSAASDTVGISPPLGICVSLVTFYL